MFSFLNIGQRALLVTAVVLAGCGGSDFPKTYSVSGTVVQNGKPVDGALVTFLSTEGGKSAVGSTNADGEFTLSTFGPGDGALPGAYKVTVTKGTAPSPEDLPELEPGVIASGDIADDYAPPTEDRSTRNSSGTSKNLLPEKYASEATSGLVASVAENDGNHFDFEL